MSRNRYSPYTYLLLTFVDLIIVGILLLVFLYIHGAESETAERGDLMFFLSQYKSVLLILLFWILVAGRVNLYKRFRFSRFLELLKGIFFQTFMIGIVIFAISGGKTESLFTFNESIYFILILFVYLTLSRFIIHNGLKYLRKKGFNLQKVIILGYNDNSRNLEHLLETKNDLGMELMDVFVAKAPQENQKEFNLKTLENYLVAKKPDLAFISLGNGIDDNKINKTSWLLEKYFIPFNFIPSTSLETKSTMNISYLDSLPVLAYQNMPLDRPINQILKRLFDIIFSLAVIVFLLSWVLPILLIAVYIFQGGPVLFSQKRNGIGGKEFNCLKIRTMRPDKNNNKVPTSRNDPRVTKIGKILRGASLDELPQFFNVLKGDMSIVGPRPHMVSENEAYKKVIKRYSLRHYVKPGITGLSQIKGYRGAIDSARDMELRIRTDIYYVRNWSFLLDLFILYKTVVLVFTGDENAI